MKEKVIEVKDLKTYFYTDDGVAKAVDGVGFTLEKGETLAIVGESGSGKSVTSLSIMGLIDESAGKIEGGEILFNGAEEFRKKGETMVDLVKLSNNEMNRVRGKDIAMIFQEPMTSLNPVFTIGHQISESLILRGMNKKEAFKRSIELLKRVEIPNAEQRIKDYPYQLSGGMRQRVMIAMALACNPSLLIADEPTTALDVTIESQILELIKNIKDDLGTSVILITHDLGIVAEVAQKVLVMYCGQVVEYAAIDSIFRQPLHPYTEGLINSMPDVDADADRLETIEGIVPSLYDLPKGCYFAPRCKYATEKCHAEKPPLREVDSRKVRCHLDITGGNQ